MGKGAYICPCGQWYEVSPCGFPMYISGCINCFEKIGGEGHVPVDREGHFRILKNQAQNKYFMISKEKQNDKNENKGIQKNTFDYYKNNNKKIRNLNQISYRLLNSIIY